MKTRRGENQAKEPGQQGSDTGEQSGTPPGPEGSAPGQKFLVPTLDEYVAGGGLAENYAAAFDLMVPGEEYDPAEVEENLRVFQEAKQKAAEADELVLKEKEAEEKKRQDEEAARLLASKPPEPSELVNKCSAPGFIVARAKEFLDKRVPGEEYELESFHHGDDRSVVVVHGFKSGMFKIDLNGNP